MNTNTPNINYQIINHRGQSRIMIQFEYNQALINRVKQLPHVRFSKTYKAWHVPNTAANRIKFKLQSQINIETKNVTTPNVAHTIPQQIITPQNLIENNNENTAVAYKNNKISDVNAHVLQNATQTLILKGYSKSTIKTYIGELSIFLQTLNHYPADSLTTNKIKDYLTYCLNTLKLTENTVHSRFNALKFYYEQVLGNEKIFYEIPRPKKPIKLPKVISEEKILKGLLAIENLKHKTMLITSYSAGLRVSEIVHLKVTDIDSDRMQIRITNSKGKKDRMVTLAKTTLEILRIYAKAHQPKTWLFEGQFKGEPISTRTAQQIFKKAFQKFNLPPEISFHSLRHSFATHSLDYGIDLMFIKELLGHNDLKTTMRYIHVSKKSIAQIESPLDRIMRNIENKQDK